MMKKLFAALLLSLLLLFNSQALHAQNRVTELIKLKPCEDIRCDEIALKNWLDSFFKKSFCYNLQFSRSVNQDGAFFSMNLIGKKNMVMDLPETPFKIALKTPIKGLYGSRMTRNIALETRNDIVAYKTDFNPATFDFKPYSYYSVAMQMLNITESEMIAHFLNMFIDNSADYKISKFTIMAKDINRKKGYGLSLPKKDEESVAWMLGQLKANSKNVKKDLYDIYIANPSREKTIKNINNFFRRPLNENVIPYVDKAINPTGKLKTDSLESLLIPKSFISKIINDTGEFTRLPFKFLEFELNRANNSLTFNFKIPADSFILKTGTYNKYSFLDGKEHFTAVTKDMPLKCELFEFRIVIYPKKIECYAVTTLNMDTSRFPGHEILIYSEKLKKK